MQAMIDELYRLKSEYDEAVKMAGEPLKEYLRDFIRGTPRLDKVIWTQYTPYFNDGDPCVFGVSDPGFFFEGEKYDEEDYRYGEGTWWRSSYEGFREQFDSPPPLETYERCESFKETLGGLSDVMEKCFGDHVRITVTHDGLEIDEHEHE
jgi:hypothetical protein